MSTRTLIIAVSLAGFVYQLIKMCLADLQRKQPLPEEVSDVYAPERYRQYLNYVADNRRSGLFFAAIRLALSAALTLSGLFRAVENAAGGNPYLVSLLTLAVFTLVETAVDIPDHYHDTFVIREKYGLNKQSKRDFVKDTLLDLLQSLVIFGGLLLLLTFIGGRLGAWTGGFSVSFGKALLIGAAIFAAVFAFALLAVYDRNLLLGISVLVLGIGHIGIHLQHAREVARGIDPEE